MYKRILAAILACLQISAVTAFAKTEAVQGNLTLHVSADGRKNGDGSEEKPYNSIEAARDALRKINVSKADVHVKIHGGDYYCTNTIEFNEKDSGTDNNPITYEAAGDGEVTLRGSKEIDFSQFEPVTDPDDVKRLADGMQQHIGVIDLKKFGFTSDMVDFISNTQKAVYEYPNILGVYLNGDKQTLAKYPNSGYLKIKRVVKEGGRYPNYSQEGNGDVIEIPNLPNLERWASAPNVQIQGYISAEYARDWRQVKTIDVTKHELTFKKYSMMVPIKNGRFQILNLLEELDVPGEWYIDKNTCKMFYYPSHNLRVGVDKLTIATFNSDFVNFKNASNITLKGINFEENASNGIVLDENSKNITISHCDLKNVGGIGVIVKGKNNLISGCRFEATSKRGADLDGGDSATLTHGNNEISNCYFYNTGIEGGGNNDGGVNVRGSGNKFKYNTMHHIECYPISYYSTECEISHNEIFNNIRNQADAACIYTGRSFSYQGNKIQYNLLYENVMFDYSSGLGSHAIAFDDWSSGGDVSHNIIYQGKKTGTVSGMGVGSRDTTACYNTTISSTLGNYANYRDVPSVLNPTGFWSGTLKELFKNTQKFDTENSKWSSKYSSYNRIIEDINADGGYILPRNQTIIGNIGVDCVRNELYLESEDIVNAPERNNVIRDNVTHDSLDIFVDPEHRDYRIKASAMKEYNFPEGLLNENNWDMNNMGVQDSVLQLEKPSGDFYKIYPRNGAKDIQRNDVILKWEPAKYADEYYYTVATDSDLKNIVSEGRTMSTEVKIEGLENGKSYYWNVTAKNISRRFANEWVSGKTPYLLTIASYDNLIKADLKSAIKTAEKLYPEIKTADTPTLGGYKPEILESLQSAINEANAKYRSSFGTQESIDEAGNKISAFIHDISGYTYQGYENLDISGAGDIIVQNGSANISYSGGAVKVKPSSPGMDAHISYKNEIPQYNSVCRFRLKLDSIDGYSMISVRNTKPSSKPYSTDAYTVVVKPDLIELQKGSKVKATCENNPQNGPIKAGEWQDWEIVTADVPGGVEYRVNIDGNDIATFYDNDSAFHQSGTLVINTYKDMSFEIASPTENKEGFYEPDLSFIETKSEIIKDNEDSSLTKDGNFKVSDKKGCNDKKVSVSDGNKASALWSAFYNVGYYKLSYYHVPLENGDENAQLTIKSGGGISGETVYKIPVDFKRGKEGWVDLGTILIMGFDGKNGEMKFEISSEGGGAIAVSGIKIEPSTEELKEITGYMYDKNSNVLLLKPNSKKAFKNMAEYTLTKEPIIENDRTLVPLRFISEAFGCDVQWIGEEQKVVITKGDKRMEFVIGSNEFTADGKSIALDSPAIIRDDTTLVPIRAISDALGKQCYWDGANKLIFICDVLGMNTSDESIFSACAKLFE